MRAVSSIVNRTKPCGLQQFPHPRHSKFVRSRGKVYSPLLVFVFLWGSASDPVWYLFFFGASPRTPLCEASVAGVLPQTPPKGPLPLGIPSVGLIPLFSARLLASLEPHHPNPASTFPIPKMLRARSDSKQASFILIHHRSGSEIMPFLPIGADSPPDLPCKILNQPHQ